MRWVLTRELDDARPLADELGLAVVPCLERVELPWPPWPGMPLLVFVTSAAVARRLRRITIPPGALIAALAPATAALVKHATFTAHGGAVALAHAVLAGLGESAPLQVLYPTSDQGLQQPEQAEAVRLLQQVGTVHRPVVYETRAPAGLREALAPHRGDGFVFYSPSAVRHFLAAGGQAGRVICVGASTARAWPRPDEVLPATHETVRSVLKENR